MDSDCAGIRSATCCGSVGEFARWDTDPTTCAAVADTAKSSATDSAGPMSMTLEHTEQRARTPVPGTLDGSMRKTERQLEQVMFTRSLLRASEERRVE